MRRNADRKFDCNRYQDYQQRNDESVHHRLCAGAAEGFEIGVQADGRKGGHHQKFADGFNAAAAPAGIRPKEVSADMARNLR